MTLDPGPNLSRAQRQYVSEVAFQLRVLPRTLRDDLLNSLRQNLTERRPPSQQHVDPRPAAHINDAARADAGARDQGGESRWWYWPDELAEITRTLGTPAEYAATLMAEAEQAEPGLMARARRRRRWAVTAMVATWVMMLGVVVGRAAWWMTWDPGFQVLTSRICTEHDSISECGQAGITDLQPATMVQVTCAADRALFIELGLVADSAVTVTGAGFSDDIGVGNMRANGLGPFSDRMFRVDAVEPWVRPTVQDYTAPSHWPITVGPDEMQPEVHFTLTTCPIDSDALIALRGGSTIVYSFTVHYRALGRDRVATVDFPRPIAITVPQ